MEGLAAAAHHARGHDRRHHVGVGHEPPVLFHPNGPVHDVAVGDAGGRLGDELQPFRLALGGERPVVQVVLLDEQRYDVGVLEHEVEPLGDGQRPGVAVRELVHRGERAHVDILLGEGLDVVELEGLLGEAAHLQLVDDLADVVVARLDQRLHRRFAHLDPLVVGNLEHALEDLDLGGFEERKVRGVVLEALQLLVVLVVADADDGDLADLYARYELHHAAAVAAAHAVNLVHDQAHLLGLSGEKVDRAVGHHLAHGVARLAGDAILDVFAGRASGIGRVHLHDFKTELLRDDRRGAALTHAGWAGDQDRLHGLILALELRSLEVDVLPGGEKLAKLGDFRAVADELRGRGGFVLVDPEGCLVLTLGLLERSGRRRGGCDRRLGLRGGLGRRHRGLHGLHGRWLHLGLDGDDILIPSAPVPPLSPASPRTPPPWRAARPRRSASCCAPSPCCTWTCRSPSPRAGRSSCR